MGLDILKFPRRDFVAVAVVVLVVILVYINYPQDESTAVFRQVDPNGNFRPVIDPKRMGNTNDAAYIRYMRRLQEHVTHQKLADLVKANKDYHSQTPFPHAAMDGLFPLDVLDAANLEIPDDPQLSQKGCVKGADQCFTGVNGRAQMFKNAVEDESKFGPATLALFRFLKAPMFTGFLENITGIQGLIPDPEYRGSGIHQTMHQGLLGIHADFNRYVKYGLHRRVNTFIFLNPDWKPEYGGHLELWSRDLKTCGAKISPDYNRFAMFTCTDFSYHGQPHPLSGPPNRSRRSLALYYYTKSRPSYECIDGRCDIQHTTLFKTTHCASCEEPVCRNLSATGL